MRFSFRVIIFILAVSSLAGCARPLLPADASMPPVDTRSPENVPDNPVHEISPAREIKTGNPCTGMPGDVCGGTTGTADESIAGLPLPPASETTETPPGRAGYEKSSGEGFSYNGETITEDTEWHGRVTILGSLSIAPQATLTIDPGTVVEFKRTSAVENSAVLLIQGRLSAVGTKDMPVSFRAAPGDASAKGWQGIVFLASEKKNVLEFCRLEGAETGVDAEYSNVTVKDSRFEGCRKAVRAENSLLYIRGCKANKCGLGIVLYDSEAEMDAVSLISNHIGIYSKKSSVYLSGSNLSGNELQAFIAEDSKVKIAKNTFERNGSGIALSACEGSVSGNVIVKNGDYGISLTGSLVKVYANDISRNDGIGMRVGDGKGIAWGNVISSNGRYDLYNAGSEDFRAIGNWWKDGHSTDAPGKFYDKSVNGKNGRVIYFPALADKPDTAL